MDKYIKEVHNGSLDNIRKLIEIHGYPHGPATSYGESFMTFLLEYSIRYWHNPTEYKKLKDLILFMIEKGANPSQDAYPTWRFKTSIYWASYHGMYEIVELLLSKGVSARQSEDSTLGHLVIELNERLFMLLVKSGANPQVIYNHQPLIKALEGMWGKQCLSGEQKQRYDNIKKVLTCGYQEFEKEEKVRLQLLEAEKIRRQKEEDDKKYSIIRKQKEEDERRIEIENEQKIINQQQNLLQKISQIASNMSILNANIDTENNNLLNSGTQLKSFMEEITKISSDLLDNIKAKVNVTKITEILEKYKQNNSLISTKELTSQELEKLKYEEKIEHFDKIKKEISELKENIFEYFLYVNNVHSNSDKYKIDENFKNDYNKISEYFKKFNKGVITQNNNQTINESFNKFNNEYNALSNELTIVKVLYSNSKPTIKHYTSQIEANNSNITQFQNSNHINKITEKINMMKSNKDTLQNILVTTCNKIQEFTKSCENTYNNNSQNIAKLEEIILVLDKKIVENEKKQSYDKVEAGTYIKLALDQVQSISSYGDNIPKELKDYYGKNIVHLLIQAKRKMPPEILKDLIPKLPESFHTYLTGEDVNIVPPWRA